MTNSADVLQVRCVAMIEVDDGIFFDTSREIEAYRVAPEGVGEEEGVVARFSFGAPRRKTGVICALAGVFVVCPAGFSHLPKAVLSKAVSQRLVFLGFGRREVEFGSRPKSHREPGYEGDA